MAIASRGGRIARHLLQRSGAWGLGLRNGSGAWGLGLRNGSREQDNTMATLAYEEVVVPNFPPSEEMKTIMFIHGLLGTGRNWRTFAKRMGFDALQQNPNSPGYRMILLDLRNHGKSASLPGFDPPHSLTAAAGDVMELIRASSWKDPEMIISHSMGGKVTLEMARLIASGKAGDIVPPKQLWVLDSVPDRVPIRKKPGEIEQVLKAVDDVSQPLPSRRWLVDHMMSLGFSKTLADWMASNLKNIEGSRDQLTWIFNARECVQMFDSFCELDCWPVVETPPAGMQIGFVRASLSNRWSSETVSKLERFAQSSKDEQSKVFYHILENAGHWLHVDNPTGLLDILVPHVVKLST